ncbi:MAG: NAD(P)/FAD-dependent oxidoreductase [Deltaproteobacteria bacterium]|nr:NAD(P)/FAD-dependent oxidoreductase [Deltaproteobacteria bacterium]
MRLLDLDVAIVGAGPGGLAAGVHAARAGLDHVVFDPGPSGGLLRAANLVENYPGYSPGLPGAELAGAITRHADELGVRHVAARVESISMSSGRFVLRGKGFRAQARTVILATGTRPAATRVPGAAAAVKKNVCHHDVRTLPKDLSGATVAVSGSGDAAFDAALNVMRRGARVEIYVRTASIKANRVLMERVREARIPVNGCTEIERIGAVARRLRLKTKHRGKAALSVKCDHLLLCHGREPEDALFRMLVGKGAALPADVQTAVRGLFCAGDLIRGSCRYAVVAAADGTRACCLAEEHIRRVKGKG